MLREAVREMKGEFAHRAKGSLRARLSPLSDPQLLSDFDLKQIRPRGGPEQAQNHPPLLWDQTGDAPALKAQLKYTPRLQKRKHRTESSSGRLNISARQE